MTPFAEWLRKSYERYLEARELIDKKSLQDPVTRPYQSKYEAQAILQSIQDEIVEQDYENDIDTNNPVNQINLIKVLIRLELGMVAVDTDETGIGQKCLESAKSLIDELMTDEVRVTLVRINICNQLGFLWCSFGEFEKACQVLNEAETAYVRWNEHDAEKVLTLDFVDCFKLPLPGLSSTDVSKKVDKSYMQCLYFLAQVYEKLGHNDKAAAYCNHTLKRQFISKEFDAIDWAINAATLSQYFAVNDDFKSARHHLAAANYVLNNHSSDLDEDERVKKAKADLSRILVKYCLILLESKDDVPESRPGLDALMDGPSLESLEKDIPVKRATNFEDARLTFIVALSAIGQAKDYYSIDEHASDHAEVIMDTSKLYRLLSKFEADRERACKMHKRRVDLLEGLLKELNPTYFLAQSRQMMFELGEIYSEMVDLKIGLLERKRDQQEVGQAAVKVNLLIRKAIKDFSDFVDSYKDKRSGLLAEKFDEENVKPIMVAYFSIGRLTSKLYTTDPRDQVNNWLSCESYYKLADDYISRNPEHEQFVAEELTLIKEMLTLIPGKMNLILNSTMY